MQNDPTVLGSPRSESPAQYPPESSPQQWPGSGAGGAGHRRSRSLPRSRLPDVTDRAGFRSSQQMPFPEPRPATDGFGTHHATFDTIKSKQTGRLGARQLPRQNMEQAGGFWKGYNKAADFEDNEFVTALGDNLDNLLIFAGLFSGVNTAFIIESLKTIQEDRAETTNELIRTVIGVLQNNVTSDDPRKESPFQPPKECVRSTTIFFCSLCCSISAAFGAVLAKQWLNYYKREGRLKPPSSRGRERQMKYEGRAQWHVEGIIETLPTILQISLFLFLIALVDFLHPINKDIGWVVMALSLVPVIFYIFTTIIATNHPLSPFQTRLSMAIRGVLPEIPYYCRCFAKDLWEHPLYELGNKLWLGTPLNFTRCVPQALCSIAFAALAWPLCVLWRLATAIVLVPYRLWGVVKPPPPLAQDQNSDTILNLKCQVFYMERASSEEDVKQVLEATQTLPTSLKLSHPVVGSFAETLVKFILKPTENSTPSEYASGNPWIDFQQLLSVLHLFYLGWKQPSDPQQVYTLPPYLPKYIKWVREELWKVFAKDPQNVDSVAMIAEIMDATKIEGHIDCSEQNQYDLCWCLQQPTLENAHHHYLPYITLLGSRPIKKYSELSLEELEDRRGTVPALLSTMTVDTKPDLDKQLNLYYTRGLVRAEVLPDFLENMTDEDAEMFVKYLSDCSRSCLNDPKKDMPVNTVTRASETARSCLVAILKLLHRHKESTVRDSSSKYRSWTRILENHGYTMLLHKFVEQRACPALALVCFISLWNRHRGLESSSVVDGDIPPYLNKETLANVVACFRKIAASTSGTKDLDLADPTLVSTTLMHAVEYFKQASLRDRLTTAMDTINADFQLVANYYLTTDIQHRERLYITMEKLKFI